MMVTDTDFILTLKNEKLKLYNRFSWFMIILLILLYIYFGFVTQNNTQWASKILILAFIAFLAIAHFFIKNKKHIPGPEVYLFFLFLGWTGLKLYWLAGVTLILMVLSSIASRKKTVLFSVSHIVYPSFPLNKISWDTLNNCLLKDGLLTIDFKNNKIIQQLIDEDVSLVDEKEFNDYCSRQLKAITGPG